MLNNDDIVLTPQEVADILKITKNTVYELIKRNELNAYKVGKKLRIDMKDVEDYKRRTRNKKQIQPITQIKQDFSKASSPIDSFVLCGQDPMLDILSRYLEIHPNGIRTLRSYVGSYNGLFALYQGNVHAATTHLWDGDTGEYNISYVEKMLPGIPFTIIHLACRTQGFYVAKGNPKGIKDWNDLKRKDITVINREKGSGTRVLLDEHLRQLGIASSNLNGYHLEVNSHLAVASTVSRGESDLGIGNEISSLSVKGVDFIPLQKERYELVIKNEDYEKPPFQTILEIINSDGFKSELKGIGRYDLEETGKIIFKR
jgi:putative molybdopterin biosynthesis protein